MFSTLALEASFPIGIPEEYGVFGGIIRRRWLCLGIGSNFTGSSVIDDTVKN